MIGSSDIMEAERQKYSQFVATLSNRLDLRVSILSNCLKLVLKALT